MQKTLEQKYIEALETIIQLKSHLDLINLKVLNYMSENSTEDAPDKNNLTVIKFSETTKPE